MKIRKIARIGGRTFFNKPIEKNKQKWRHSVGRSIEMYWGAKHTVWYNRIEVRNLKFSHNECIKRLLALQQPGCKTIGDIKIGVCGSCCMQCLSKRFPELIPSALIIQSLNPLVWLWRELFVGMDALTFWTVVDGKPQERMTTQGSTETVYKIDDGYNIIK